MENTVLPQELSAFIGNESKEFSVKAIRAVPLKKSFSLIFFGIIWMAFTSIFLFAFFGPLLFGKEVHFESNGVPTVASLDNLNPLIGPGIFIGFFIFIGLIILSLGIYFIFKKGGYFVGTPTRLVHFQGGNIRSIDWEQFSGDIEVSGNSQRGNISLKMRTGQMIRKKNRPDQYIPDVVYILEVPNAFEIGQICRKRIKENDPTPVTANYNNLENTQNI